MVAVLRRSNPRACGGAAAAGAVEAGLSSTLVECCESAVEAATRLESRLTEGDVVLVKGSRGAKMEEIVARLGGRS